jgi:hypothetical protein
MFIVTGETRAIWGLSAGKSNVRGALVKLEVLGVGWGGAGGFRVEWVAWAGEGHRVPRVEVRQLVSSI